MLSDFSLKSTDSSKSNRTIIVLNIITAAAIVWEGVDRKNVALEERTPSLSNV